MRRKHYYIYIITNHINSVLYTGVTNNLIKRIGEHRAEINKNSFSARYKLKKLVYYETYESIYDAILREKQIKAGSRRKKVELILKVNPAFQDLFCSLEEVFF